VGVVNGDRYRTHDIPTYDIPVQVVL